jgi:hypothetical protein
MPQRKKEELVADLTQVHFPSDQLTLAQLRRDQPELLFSDKELLDSNRRITDVRMFETMRTEHILANKAWAKAIGLPDPFPTHNHREEISFLNDDYQRYGLSTGAKQTAELVRAFENEAANLARLAVGEGR